MKAFHLVGYVFASSTILGCSGGKVDIGDKTNTALGQKLSDYAGTWDGYAEAYQFDTSGSDRIRIQLNASGEGTVTVGDAASPPPPTDPDVGYPPGAGTTYVYDRLLSGFEYPVHGPRLDASRIRLDVAPSDLMAQWCALQTPILDEINTQEPMYNCVPNWNEMWSDTGCYQQNPDTNEWVPLDCGKAAACDQRVCNCSADGCVATGPVYPIDAALESNGDELVGTFVTGSERVTIRLARQ